jgi:hypothetical protein
VGADETGAAGDEDAHFGGIVDCRLSIVDCRLFDSAVGVV